MKLRKLFAALLLLASMTFVANAQDGTVFYSVTNYLKSLMNEPVSDIIAGVDELIESSDDKTLNSQIAGIVYDYFAKSPIMGHDAVAVHVADNWFLNKKLEWSDQSTYPQLYTYAEFNRSSLIGMPAPELEMENDKGAMISVRDVQSDYKLLYFFDDQCSSCAKETPALAQFLKSYKGKHLTAFIVYTQSDKKTWIDYVKENFGKIKNSDVDIITLWDPESNSDYQKKYGVIATPKMLLLDYQNVIIGRGLNCDALQQLLGVETAYWQQSNLLLDAFFNEAGEDGGQAAEEMAAAYFNKYAADTAVFCSAFNDLFTYLRNSDDIDLQNAAVAILSDYVIGHPEYWASDYVASIKKKLTLSI